MAFAYKTGLDLDASFQGNLVDFLRVLDIFQGLELQRLFSDSNDYLVGKKIQLFQGSVLLGSTEISLHQRVSPVGGIAYRFARELFFSERESSLRGVLQEWDKKKLISLPVQEGKEREAALHLENLARIGLLRASQEFIYPQEGDHLLVEHVPYFLQQPERFWVRYIPAFLE